MLPTPPPWVAPWIGLPFRQGGRGPDAYDCWGLLRAVIADRLGVALPSLDDRYADLRGSWDDRRLVMAGLLAGPERDLWRAIASRPAPGAPLAWGEDPQIFDGVLIRRETELCHVAVVVAVGRARRVTVLHTENRVESHLADISGPALANQVDSVWRLKALDQALAA